VPAASVVTVHTIHHYVVPKMIARSSLAYRRALMPRTLRRAERIITISDFVRHSVHRLLGIPCDRMVTVYHGVQDSSGNGHLPHDPQLPSKYILFVSALWPYKNAVRLVEAFALLKREQIEHKLVMVGGGWESCRREVESVAREKGVREEIILTGRVPDVWNYYRHADVFVYPSLHEEFGMPVLEAMLAGVPVVTSNRGSLPEIAGGAAVITDVEHPSEIAGALKRVLSDRALRTELVARGRTRAANFTWEKTARQTVQAYGDAHERRKRQGTQSSGGRQPKRLAGMPK
jgi:glycosyltransferase involved in cell wall biosynthesis